MPSIFRKPVAIDKGVYAMSMDEARNAEITMYGQIVERQPTNWWTGEPIPGNYIIQDEFLADLNSISKAKSVTIRMNSLGVYPHSQPPAGVGGKGHGSDLHCGWCSYVRRLVDYVCL